MALKEKPSINWPSNRCSGGEELRPKMLRVINELTDQIDFDFLFKQISLLERDILVVQLDMLVNFRCFFSCKQKEVSVPLLTSYVLRLNQAIPSVFRLDCDEPS